MLEAIDMLLDRDAAAWLDSTTQYKKMVDEKEATTLEDVEEFKEAFKCEFPVKVFESSEIPV